jgi:hypothetical protein
VAEEAKEMAPSGKPRLVTELSEDLDVAIREFLERHPSTGARRVRQAIHRVERGLPGGRTRRVAALFAMLAAFGVGVVLGLLVG